MRKPNFFIVGFFRSGTTALYVFLREHPEIYMPYNKEISYFCKDFHSPDYFKKLNQIPVFTEEQYLKLFKEAKNEKAVGEACVHYIFSKDAPYNIFKFNPDAKIIVMLRDKVEMLQSYHSVCLLNDWEDEPDFIKALKLEETRKQGKNIPKGCPHPSFLYYSNVVDYETHIARFKELFKNVMVIDYADFKVSNSSIYSQVCRFLGVDDKFNPNYRTCNPNMVAKNNWLKKQVLKLKIYFKKLPDPIYHLFSIIYRNTIIKKIKRRELTEEEINFVRSL